MLNEVVIVAAGMGSSSSGGPSIEEVPVPECEVPESEISVEISSEPLYCICQEPWDIHNRRFMIHCDHCSDWFHGLCVGISEEESKGIEKYHCPKCVPIVGHSVEMSHQALKISRRMRSIRCNPQFIEKLKSYKFHIPDEVVLKMRGQALTLPSLLAKGFTRPIFVESVEGLGMKLPEDNFTVRDVERYVGSDRMVDVIDVERQTDMLMSMQEFADYFTSPNRHQLLNLISLEFSRTNLSKLVEAPVIARKLDWVPNFWPSSQPSGEDDTIQRPTVQKYCLISAKDSYTDFHIDFGGTSVWYHVLWGEKVFYLMEPSETNLNIYHRWMEGEMGNDCFLADEIPLCFRCVLKKGQTLMIPTGWIHAVYTPEDSLVFGGNFLHLLNMDVQLQVYEIEKKLKTPAKYLFPSYESTHWYAAKGLVEVLQTLNSTSYIPASVIKGLKALIQALRVWLNEKDIGRVRLEYIPRSVNCKKVIHDLCKELRAAEKRVGGSAGKDTGIKDKEMDFKGKRVIRRESNSAETSYSVSSSREGSPTHQMKFHLSRALSQDGASCSSILPPSPINTGRIKLKLKRHAGGQMSSEESQTFSADSSPNDPRSPKIRISITEGRIESSMDAESSTGSDALHIAESDHTADSDRSDPGELVIDLNKHRSHKKHHHHKKHHKKSKNLKEQNRNEKDSKNINDVLAGTLDGLEELFQTSNYSERITRCENTSQAIKDSVAGLSAMKHTILPIKKKKHRKRKHKTPTGEGEDESSSDDSLGGIERVHQDEDYIYLPLAGSDDESQSKTKRGKKEEDSSWCPGIKVGPVGHREVKSSRLNAKRKAVEKGLEKASIALENQARKKLKTKMKLKQEKIAKVKTPKLVHSDSMSKPSTTSSMDIATKTSILAKKFAEISPSSSRSITSKKPKKGMVTAKQRLGKILKINKFTRF